MSTTDIARHEGSALTIHDDQQFFTDQQIAALQQLGVRNATRGDLAVFFHQAQRTGLDPFARQIYMIERQGKQTIQTGIDGFRLIARRATDSSGGTLGYEDTQWCGPDGQWVDVWLSSEAPAAARVTVVRNGDRFPAIALFSEYAGRKRDGSLSAMWETKGALMLAKCAEALALRKAFPQDLSGLYTGDEMQQANNPTVTTTTAAASRTGGTAALRDRLRAQQPEPEPEPEPVGPVEIAECEDRDQLRTWWSTHHDLRDLIEARVHDLDHVDQDTGEVIDAEIVEPGDVA